MCGICGKVNRDPACPVDEQLIHRMCDVIEHRGPDDEGFYIQGNVGIGMRRLSIIDLSGGRQPIFNEDNSIVVILNGEIYNFQEIRAELIAKGHQFRTKSDTEAIVHLYEDYGEECVHKLRGMFGFALYDTRKKKLMVARDRLGIKPIYYAFDGQKILFGSELKSLLQDDSLSRELDYFALNCYFSFMNTIAPDSIFKSVRKLMPGQYLIFENNQLRIKTYWNFKLNENEKLTEADCVERLIELMREAVKVRLIADVPLGAFLSGGIDSSTVVALMSQIMDQPVKTFSIGFKSKIFNELEYAGQIAKLFKTDHHEYIVEPDAVPIIDDLIWYLDEPFSDPSAIPTYFVSKIARENVTVVLTGDGGDEMFGGYSGYNVEALLNQIGQIPKFVRNKLLKNFLKFIPNTPSARFNEERNRFLRNLERVDLPAENRFFSRHQVFDAQEKNLLYTPDFLQALDGEFNIADRLSKYVNFPKGMNSINSMLHLDTHLYLPNDMLMKVDKMSMAVSLEARVPLLDHVLAEFVATIPWHLKVNGSTTKHILKKAMSRILPHEILYRKKQGFNVPLNEWFRNDLVSLASSILLDSKSTNRGILQRHQIEKILSRHQQKEQDLSFQIWTLIVFEKWCRRFLDQSPTKGK
ncbi:asparagine synthase (glutamine-hydrolyzing) [candidate division KSB1 bacterium]|nr:asparagine synthase (glutamine-hydrolyzing) [candidate division KSB1 bacterium]